MACDPVLESMLNRTVEVKRRTQTAVNELGEPTYSQATSSSFKAAIQPTDASEARWGPGEHEVATHKMYCCPDADVGQHDMIIFEGKWFEVIGIMDDGGRSHHQKIFLRIVQ